MYDKKDEATQAKDQAEFQSNIQNSLYNVMALDIESTVGAAVDLCLHDTSVDKETRRARAMGLLKLGKIFQGGIAALGEKDTERKSKEETKTE